jgi:hypothetical protein
MVDGAVSPAISSAFDSAQESSGGTVQFGESETTADDFGLNLRWSELDRIPTDIASNRGIFITSKDKKKLLRLYGSLRMRANYDDRDNSSPWALDYSLLPTGAEDDVDHRYEYNARGSRVGMDLTVRELLSVRMEFDFRGTKDELRRRHMYLRTEHWVLGKNWTAFNTLPYLPFSLDYHSIGAHAGFRTPQIKYLNGVDLSGGDVFKYQLSLEFNDPKFAVPEVLEATANNVIPNLAGHVARGGDWGQVRFAWVLAPNRIRFTDGSRNDLGGGLQTGLKLNLGDSNIFKTHVIGMSGQNSLMADFTPGDFDMVYDPVNNDFENLVSVGAGVSLRHFWNPALSTTIGGSYINFDLPDYLDDQFFDRGNKALINLVWQPKEDLDGLTTGVEWIYGTRIDKDGRSSESNRLIFALWYDF